MESLFLNIYQYFQSKRFVFWTCMILLFTFLGITASNIRFEEDISKILPKSEEGDEILSILENIKFTDKTVILVNSENDPLAAESYADELLNIFEQDTNKLFGHIQGKVDDNQFFDLLDRVENHLPLFLDSTDYSYLENQLHKDSIEKRVKSHAELAFNNNPFESVFSFREDPFNLIPRALQKFSVLQGGNNFKIESQFIKSKDSKTLYLFITPQNSATETEKNTEFVSLIENSLDSLNQQYADNQVKGSFFGSTAVSVANAEQIKKDIQISLSIALTVLLVFFIYFYKRLLVPLIIITPVAFGSLLGIAVLFWIKGTISAVSIGIGSVLLGLTLDYSLHILSHYRKTQDIKVLIKSTNNALIMCAVFTSVDFLCLLFLRSEVLQDLGIFASVSVMGSALFALIFIPQVYKPKLLSEERDNTWVDKISQYNFEKKPFFVVLALGLVVLSLFTYKKVGFDNNLDNLHYQPPHLKEAMNEFEMAAGNTGKGLYVVSYGDDWMELTENHNDLDSKLEKLKQEGLIENYTSIASLIPSPKEQENQLEKWNSFWASQNLKQIENDLVQSGASYGFKENTYQPFFELINQEFEFLDSADSTLHANLQLQEWIQNSGSVHTILSTIRIEENQNIDTLQKILNSTSTFILDRKEIQESFLKNIEADFDNLIWITSLAMFLVIFLFFRRLELTLITNIPVFLGWFVTLGLMGLFEVNFNAFNIIIATLVFGLGIDYAIFITKALIERYTYGTKDISVYRSGIIMSASATLLCFGILIFAEHPAIYSIAVIPLIGLGVVVLMSFTIQPLLFNFFIQNPQNKGNKPRTIENFLWTVYTFGYFFGGGLILSLISQFYYYVSPSKPEKKQLRIHKWMQLFFKGLMYSTPNCKIRIVDSPKNAFDKPVILITNHTSQLDTPTVGMLHSQLIFMVNERVLNSGFFGRTIQNLGFYSTESTLDLNQNLEEIDSKPVKALQHKIEQGYSIIIFPEGTRSMTGEIGRFKKGAFLLSEKLELDILPVLVHGNTDLLPKYDNILKPGDITIKFLPAINAQDDTWGKSYSQKAKKVSAYFKEEFSHLKNELETGDYFWSKLKFNYIYKAQSIRRKAKQDFDFYKNDLPQINRIIPEKSKVLIWESGMGVLNLLLSYHKPSLQILGYSEQAENVHIAKNTYSAFRNKLIYADNLDALNYSLLDLKPNIIFIKHDSVVKDLIIESDYLDILIVEFRDSNKQHLNPETLKWMEDLNLQFSTKMGAFHIYNKI